MIDCILFPTREARLVYRTTPNLPAALMQRDSTAFNSFIHSFITVEEYTRHGGIRHQRLMLEALRGLQLIHG